MADYTLGFAITAMGHLIQSTWRLAEGILSLSSRAFVSSRAHSRRTRTMHKSNTQHMRASGRPGQVSHNPAFTPLIEKPMVSFSDIAGLEEAKSEILLRMVYPILHPEQAKTFGMKIGGGVLLYGPPGTGKTLLCKAIATEIDASFFLVRPSDIMSRQIGQAEANVARLFAAVRREPHAVLCIDEIESLVPRRARNRSTIMQRVVSQFLSEVDGLAGAPSDHSYLLIGTTNQIEMVDPAMLRSGRFDAKIYIGLPDLGARRQILVRNLEMLPLEEDVYSLADVLAWHTDGMSGAQIVGLARDAAANAFLACIQTPMGDRKVALDDFDLPRSFGEAASGYGLYSEIPNG